MSDSDTQQRLELAKEIAKSAGRLTLNYFQTDRFDVIKKGDGSPLTIADQEAEKHLRAAIGEAFPSDAIVGEEFGRTEGDSGYCWILDPIDGTKSFISGVPLYGTMVGVEKIAEPSENHAIRQSVIGSVFIPGLDVGIYASKGAGAWSFKGDGEPERAQVSSKSNLSDAVLVTSGVDAFADRDALEVYQQLAESVYFCRTWGDVYGYYLVAVGRVEIMIDPILNIWDAAAVQPIIEEAGGRFTDWAGNNRMDAGESIGSNGLVHDSIIEMTRAIAGKFPESTQ
jgi:histidinol phosphatase-like enzyme (inositol monophosphatase family)